ncbi:MAG: GNAT family N-acetyltransferase [Bdellovibrionales bacterium]|nr:GNAT family N-acetyltransferase [Bdellovibrionales bacterium]
MSSNKSEEQNKASLQTSFDFPSITIRKIKTQDNQSVKNIIHTVMPEFGASGEGFAIHDPEVENMYQAYDKKAHVYFVAEKQNKILGGAGIATLKGADGSICELQKMYLLAEARGLGLGRALIEACLSFAKQQGFTKCYIETTQQMQQAQKLYEQYGFDRINNQLGHTGHFGCDVFYLKNL